MPDNVFAPVANQLQIPDYTKTLNALSQMQLNQAHTDLSRLQVHQQQLREQALGAFRTDHNPQHLIDAGMASEAHEAQQYGVTGQGAYQNFKAYLGATLPTIDPKHQAQWLASQIGDAHGRNILSQSQGQSLYDEYKARGAKAAGSWLSSGPTAVQSAEGLPAKLVEQENQGKVNVNTHAGNTATDIFSAGAQQTGGPVNLRGLNAAAHVGYTGQLGADPNDPGNTKAIARSDAAAMPHDPTAPTFADRYSPAYPLTRPPMATSIVKPPTAPDAIAPTEPAPPAAAPGTVNILSPAQVQENAKLGQGRGEAGNKVLESSTDKYNKSFEFRQQIGKMYSDLATMGTNNFLGVGAMAKERVEVAKMINAALTNVLGAKAGFDPNKIAASESANKGTVKLGQESAALLGTREAAQIIQQSVGATPGQDISDLGSSKIMGPMVAIAHRHEQLGAFLQGFKGNPAQGEVVFNKQHPISQYVEEAKLLSGIDKTHIADVLERGNEKFGDKTRRQWFDVKYGKGHKISNALLGDE